MIVTPSQHPLSTYSHPSNPSNHLSSAHSMENQWQEGADMEAEEIWKCVDDGFLMKKVTMNEEQNKQIEKFLWNYTEKQTDQKKEERARSQNKFNKNIQSLQQNDKIYSAFKTETHFTSTTPQLQTETHSQPQTETPEQPQQSLEKRLSKDYTKNIPGYIIKRCIRAITSPKFQLFLNKKCSEMNIDVLQLKEYCHKVWKTVMGPNSLYKIFDGNDDKDHTDGKLKRGLLVMIEIYLRKHYVLQIVKEGRMSNFQSYIKIKNQSLLYFSTLYSNQ